MIFFRFYFQRFEALKIVFLATLALTILAKSPILKPRGKSGLGKFSLKSQRMPRDFLSHFTISITIWIFFRQDPEVNDASSSHFFIFFTTFSFLHSPRCSFLLVAPSSSSFLPPRPSFLLVPPSSLFLFLPRPALSQSLRIHKRPFFIDFDESVTDGPTNGPTDGRTDGQGLL